MPRKKKEETLYKYRVSVRYLLTVNKHLNLYDLASRMPDILAAGLRYYKLRDGYIYDTKTNISLASDRRRKKQPDG